MSMSSARCNINNTSSNCVWIVDRLFQPLAVFTFSPLTSTSVFHSTKDTARVREFVCMMLDDKCALTSHTPFSVYIRYVIEMTSNYCTKRNSTHTLIWWKTKLHTKPADAQNTHLLVWMFWDVLHKTMQSSHKHAHDFVSTTWYARTYICEFSKSDFSRANCVTNIY